MYHSIDDISEISLLVLYGKEIAFPNNQLQEVSLYQSLKKKKNQLFYFKDSLSLIMPIPWHKKCVIWTYAWFIRKLYLLFPKMRPSKEMSFKSVLASLLSYKNARECFIGTADRKKKFLKAICETSKEIDLSGSEMLHCFEFINYKNSQSDSLQFLCDTYLESLLTPYSYKREILSYFLKNIERLPIQSVLHVKNLNQSYCMQFTTEFVKYTVKSLDSQSGKITYNKKHHKISPPLPYSKDKKNSVHNQRRVIVSDNGILKKFCYCCGEITTIYHGFEQLFLMKGIDQEEVRFYKKDTFEKDADFVFLSLYSLSDYEKILKQKKALDFLDQKILAVNGNEQFLNLYYFNIPFGSKPTLFPNEALSIINDVSDQNLIKLCVFFIKKLSIDSATIIHLSIELEEANMISDLIKRQNRIAEIIDHFRKYKDRLIEQCLQINSDLSICMQRVLSQKDSWNQPLDSMDFFIYFDLLLK